MPVFRLSSRLTKWRGRRGSRTYDLKEKNMKNLHILLAATLFWKLLGAVTAVADVITAFSAKVIQDRSFAINLNTTFSGNLARITHSLVANNSVTPCLEEVATFHHACGPLRGRQALAETIQVN